MTEVSAETKTELEKRYRTAAFLVFGLIATLLILVVSAFFLVNSEVERQIADNTIMTLRIGALFIALGTFIIRRLLYRWERLRDIVLLKGITGLIRTLATNAVLLAVMAEAVVIIGFVITFLTGDIFEMIRAAIIALVVFIINFPRKSIWKKIVANLENI